MKDYRFWAPPSGYEPWTTKQVEEACGNARSQRQANNLDRQRQAMAPRPKLPTVRSTANDELESRRLRLERDRDGKLYQTCLHEAGHALLLLLNGVKPTRAAVRQDLSGEVNYDRILNRDMDREISVAGAAAVSAFGFTPSGLSHDNDCLRATGMRPTYEGRESAFAVDLRQSVEKDIRSNRQFVKKLADELYIYCGHEVSGERIAELWKQYR